MGGPGARQVELGQRTRRRLAAQLGLLGPGRRGLEGAHHGDRVAVIDEAQAPGALGIGQATHHADHRRGEDRTGRCLVVERDVAAHDRHLQRQAGGADPLHRLHELPSHVGFLGVAEVQAVGETERLAPTQARLAAHS